ncbi:MAG: helix-turn-helix transcriptional regulator [Minisyncoccia bacterium]|jgi:transcriptional regulator with XRE-family HTH domain
MIRKLRVGRDINQMVFADIVGIRFSKYTAIEGGAEKPTPQMLQRIARELNCEA